jgi:hypothetical protein
MFLEIPLLPSDFLRHSFIAFCGGLKTAQLYIMLKVNTRAIIRHLLLIFFCSNISTGRNGFP